MRLLNINTVIILVTLLYSCKPIAGDCPEKFMFSPDNVVMPYTEDSIAIKVLKDDFWISGIVWNEESITDAPLKYEDMNLIVKHEQFTLSRMPNNIFKIVFRENTANTQNVFSMYFQGGNCFGDFKVIQEGQ